MSDKFDDQLFKRLEDLRGQVDEAKLDALEKRLDEVDRSLAYHTQQAAEAHSPDLRIANLEIIEKRRGEIAAIAAEVDELELRAAVPNRMYRSFTKGDRRTGNRELGLRLIERVAQHSGSAPSRT